MAWLLETIAYWTDVTEKMLDGERLVHDADVATLHALALLTQDRCWSEQEALLRVAEAFESEQMAMDARATYKPEDAA